MFFLVAGIFADDCMTLKNRKEICGKIELQSENFWKKNKVIVNDTLKLNLGDVNKLVYDGTRLVRATPGEMLSNFGILKDEGRLSIYEKRESFQSGTQTFYSAKSKYFSIDNDTLYYFNLGNLRDQILESTTSGKYLQAVNTKKWIGVGIRIASIIPFIIGIGNTQDERASRYLGPFGIGITLLALPSFTLRPSMRKDIGKAIEAYNKE